MKKLILSSAVAVFTLSVTENAQASLGLCNKLRDGAERECGGKSGAFAKAECRFMKWVGWGACKALTGGLGAAEHAQLQENCKATATSEQQAACEKRLNDLFSKNIKKMITDFENKDEAGLQAELVKEFKADLQAEDKS